MCETRFGLKTLFGDATLSDHAFGYRRSEAPRRPTLDGYVGVIDEILHTDIALIKKTTSHVEAHL